MINICCKVHASAPQKLHQHHPLAPGTPAPSLRHPFAQVRTPGHPIRDGRATSLENQVLAPIANTKEMGLGHEAMVERFSAIAGYRPYFREAFGADDITRERVAAALADYVRTRMSGNAPYDRWAYGRDRRALSEQAQRGSEVFFFSGQCATWSSSTIEGALRTRGGRDGFARFA